MSELLLRADILPAAQRRLWDTGMGVPPEFVLYGGTALALRLAHGQSIDFDFFSAEDFAPAALLRRFPDGDSATLLQSERNTLTLLTGGANPVKVSFIGGIGFSPVKRADTAQNGIPVACLEDLQRSEAKDYFDIATLLAHGLSLEYGLGCARAFYGSQFNTALPLKALVYFEDGDLPSLPRSVRESLAHAVARVGEIVDVPATGLKIGARPA